MFDNKQAPQPIQPNIQPAEPKPEPVEPVTPNTKAPPDLPAEDKPAEDIFSQVDPSKESSAATSVTSPSTPEVKTPSVEPVKPVEEEPAIKTPPTVFTKKKDAPVPGDDVKMPEMPAPTPQPPMLTDKKNIVLFAVIIILVIGLVAVAIWWFTGRGKKSAEPAPANQAVLDLFNQVKQGQVETTQSETGQEPEEQEPQGSLPVDSDGDGLSDEEEMLLGTSLQSSDTDNDGLFDREEVKVYNTDPLKADTDGDGMNDGDEVQNNKNPLSPDAPIVEENFYSNDNFKFEFEYLDGMVLESAVNNIVLFNDNVNQIKLYIYLNNSQSATLLPDMSYEINEDGSGKLIIKSNQLHTDETPSSTQYNTQAYQSKNGLTYLIRYVASKRASDHQIKFEQILSTFKFLP